MKREKGLLTNVDFYSASTYHYMGIPGDQFTPIFALSRLSGWAAHVMEQLANNRLIRPRAEYGPCCSKVRGDRKPLGCASLARFLAGRSQSWGRPAGFRALNLASRRLWKCLEPLLIH